MSIAGAKQVLEQLQNVTSNLNLTANNVMQACQSPWVYAPAAVAVLAIGVSCCFIGPRGKKPATTSATPPEEKKSGSLIVDGSGKASPNNSRR